MRRIAYICMISLALAGASVTAEAHGFGGGAPQGMHGGGFRGGGGGWHHGGGGGWHHDGGHYGHHGHFHGGVVVGVGPYWDPWWGYPNQTIVVQQPPEYVYSEPAPSSGTWYYCSDYGQYYPYVKDCPSGWTAVAPPSP